MYSCEKYPSRWLLTLCNEPNKDAIQWLTHVLLGHAAPTNVDIHLSLTDLRGISYISQHKFHDLIYSLMAKYPASQFKIRHNAAMIQLAQETTGNRMAFKYENYSYSYWPMRKKYHFDSVLGTPRHYGIY